ncbi:MAG: DUF4317 family protein [Lachnospiraceae bacterium]|uniref:DUF4317 family protein n=1 Tax=Candidatus Weimeria bifida TaxID=2599074 RepID=A0A6N7J1K6_9FIRM|nr:DUF4317 family protein [Candidatus Weimeria bifida]RRF96502.1 MAG: DUF4317 family protein [Lachnospiraceae bacterium]
MTKKDILEIKRRYKKESHNFTRIAGCYVDNEKNKILSFSESPLELEDEEFFKYLEIANKCLSGKLGNNILQLPFPNDEIMGGEKYSLLMQLKATGLKDETVLDEFFDNVIENYLITGNFLIVLFDDIYDIPMKTTDNIDLGDSEDVFEYILCAICPVNLSKSALGYREDEDRIGALVRNWTVTPVESAFMFPSFSDRNADVNTVTVYTKNAKAPHKEFWENGLHAESRLTSTEKKNAFTSMVEKSVGSDTDESKEAMFNIADSLSGFIEKQKETLPEDAEVGITGDDVEDICVTAGVPEEKAERIKERFNDSFEGTPDAPAAGELLDSRLLKDQELHHEKAALQREVASLNKVLSDSGIVSSDGTTSDIYVKVPEDREAQVTTAFVDGEKCLIIPLDPSDTASVNGEEVSL